MAQAAATTIKRSLTIADLNTEIDDEPRVLDVVLGEGLGFSRPRAIRQIVERNTLELQGYGSLATRCGKSRGQHFTEYYLNEPQALLICMFSNTARAAEVRKMLIDVFMEYRRSRTLVKVQAHERRTSTRLDKALTLARSIDRLEALAARLNAPAHGTTSMTVGGRTVVVDVNDFMMEGDDEAVILRHDGSLEITKPVNVVLGDNRFGRDDVFRFEGRRVYARHQQHGARSGYTPPQGSIRHGCVILGKVVRDQHANGQPVYAEHSVIPEPAAIPAPRQRRKPMPPKDRARVIKLYRENRMQPCEIAPIVGYPYHMVQRITAAYSKTRMAALTH